MIVKHIGLASQTNEMIYISLSTVLYFILIKSKKKTYQNIIKQMTSVTTVIGDVGFSRSKKKKDKCLPT